MKPIINNILDTDLYKITMGQAVGQLFPNAMARYTFINRGKTGFRPGFGQELQEQVNAMARITATGEQFDWLGVACPYLSSFYVDYLRGYRFNPEEVGITQDGTGKLEINVEGPWHRTILWEVPLLALVSELHFKGETVDKDSDDRDWTKLNRMDRLKFADFGTRRRFSRENQWRVIRRAQKICPHAFIGSSNVLLSYEIEKHPVGTMAHEWISFHGAVEGYTRANVAALRNWASVYKGVLGIALTDTYGTKSFFRDLPADLARLYDGLRQDSGDPFQFIEDAFEYYESKRIDPASKTLVFSDGLDCDRARIIQERCREKGRQRAGGRELQCSFGIGTNLTNDVGVKPLNIVMKMTGCKPNRACEWVPVVKLSDVAGKHTGEPAEVERARQMVDYEPQAARK